MSDLSTRVREAFGELMQTGCLEKCDECCDKYLAAARRLLSAERLSEVEWRMVLTDKIYPDKEYIDLTSHGRNVIDDMVEGAIACQDRLLGEAKGEGVRDE